MGSFGGHALPGSFFIIFALWYVVHVFRRYFLCRQRNTRFTSTVTFPCSCLCGRLKELPIEAAVKLFFVTVGFSLEIYTGFSHGQFVNIGNGQHATMFFFFGLSGIIDILVYLQAPLPPDVDYIINAMALTVEGLLFRFHLHGRTDLDVLVHTLLIYAIVANVVSVLVEMKFRHSLMAVLARAYFLLLQGTWFWQVGFILYPFYTPSNPWRQDDHEHMMLACLFFAWHVGANFVLILLIGCLMACCFRHRGGLQSDDVSMKRLIHTSPNGQTMVSLNDDDSESDVEFQKPLGK